MAQGTNYLEGLRDEQPPEEIRAEMADTRSALTEKLEVLEERVKSTVEAAQCTVENTVETVRESVHDTVESVKRTFDVRHHVEQHPCVMVSAAVAAGYVLGNMIPGKRPAVVAVPFNNGNGGYPASLSAMTDGARKREPAARPSKRHKHGLLSNFHDEIEMLEKAAIGSVMGLVRDWLKQTIPPLAPQLDKVMDSATAKMGGEPVGATMAGTSRF